MDPLLLFDGEPRVPVGGVAQAYRAGTNDDAAPEGTAEEEDASMRAEEHRGDDDHEHTDDDSLALEASASSEQTHE